MKSVVGLQNMRSNAFDGMVITTVLSNYGGWFPLIRNIIPDTQ